MMEVPEQPPVLAASSTSHANVCFAPIADIRAPLPPVMKYPPFPILRPELNSDFAEEPLVK